MSNYNSQMKKILKPGMRVHMDNGCEVELIEKGKVAWKCRNVNKTDGGTFFCFEDELTIRSE